MVIIKYISRSIDESRIPLVKNLLAPLGITAAVLVVDAGIKKKYIWFRDNNFNNFKRRKGRHNEIR